MVNRAIAAIFVLLVIALVVPLRAADESDAAAWESLQPPSTSGGLFLVPRMTDIGGRLHLFWSGTDEKVRSPELFHCSRADGDPNWTDAHAPFFGAAMNKVRQLEVASSRDVIGIIFQRQMPQGPRALEILTTFSSDNGWGFSRPFVIDSFVGPDSKGSCVSIGARDGKSPEFALAWAVDGHALRATSLDFRSFSRPGGATVGHHDGTVDKIEIAGAGNDGFMAVFNETNTLRTARVKPLTGGVEPARGVVKGAFGRSFTAASRPKGPIRLVTLEQGELVSYEYKDDIWAKQENTRTELGGNAEVRSDMDDSKSLHLGVLVGNKIYHVTDRGDEWSKPQPVIELDPNLPFSGFDIAATNDYVYVAAAQNQRLYVKRRKLETLP
ncbi:MAG: hypothetical protein HY319_11655 [Armatimonadetes bacterium]|nr:hypothetical protein [Armatimonadota bacterium]